MEFESILFKDNTKRNDIDDIECPSYFKDLNLDKIIDNITNSRKKYNLKPYFYKTLNSSEEVKYRHEVMKDIEKKEVFKFLDSFSERINFMREKIRQSKKLHYEYQRDALFLEATSHYCDAVINLLKDLNNYDVESEGLVNFREFLSKYIKSEYFIEIKSEIDSIKEKLGTIKYCISIRENNVSISKYEDEKDYGLEVSKAFEKFKEEKVHDYTYNFDNALEMTLVEEKILDKVAFLNPKEFQDLHSYYNKYQDFENETVINFDREIQFYMAYIEYIEEFEKEGLKFCYPEVSDINKEIYVDNCFDLALADKLKYEEKNIVCNDFYLKDKERIFVISGPNQGGKTTFARTFGQVNYFGSLGCMIPGTKGRTYLFDNIFTHFEREESIKSLSGKLQDDLFRIHDVLEKATSKSIIIMNEIFSSTTLKDALFLGEEVLRKIIEKDMLCICITFVDELGDLSDSIVTMVSNVNPENFSVRTYKIVRKNFDGHMYAMSIAEKYGLTYSCIKERIL